VVSAYTFYAYLA
jgi:hypothetical protein